MEDYKLKARSLVLNYQVCFHLDFITAKLLAIKECQSIIDYIDTKGNGYMTLSDELRSDVYFYNNIINEIESI